MKEKKKRGRRQIYKIRDRVKFRERKKKRKDCGGVQQ